MSIYQRGKNKKWYCKFQINGVRHTLALKNAVDKKTAELLEAELKVKYSGGEVINTKDIKFFWLCDKFEEYAKNNRKNYDKDKGMIKKLKNFYGNCDLTTFEPYMVERYRTKRKNDGMKPATINKEVGILRRMFSIAVDNGWLKRNPAVKKLVKPLYVENTDKKILSIEEEKKLLTACKGDCAFIKPIIICALHSAMRKSEILNLKWQNVDLENKLITILIQKNRKKSYIPISNKLNDELKKLYSQKSSDYVFVNPLTNQPYVNIRNSYNKVLEQAGIKEFTFHSLRHTACTRMIERGVPIDVVQAIMRHSNISITLEVYNHINQDRKIKAIQTLNDYCL